MPEQLDHQSRIDQADASTWFERQFIAPRWLRHARRRIALYLTGAALAAPLLSIAVHMLLGVAAYNIVVSASGPPGGDGAPAGSLSGPMAVETQLVELPQGELSGEDVSVDELASFDAPAVDVPTGGAGLADLPAGAEGSLSDLGAAGLGGAGGGSGGSMGEGFGLSEGGGGGGAARFFGVEARGSRFAYIVDISGSMQGARLEELKKQLNSTVDGLLNASSYVIVLFNSNAVPLGGRPRWRSALDRNKRETFRAIQAIQASGGTQPVEAFEIVLSMNPKPDAIYFMTDGVFQSTDVVAVIERLNGQDGRVVPIHCIAFGEPEAERHMRPIAASSGGTYSFVPASDARR